jgi:hypothetical protein
MRVLNNEQARPDDRSDGERRMTKYFKVQHSIFAVRLASARLTCSIFDIFAPAGLTRPAPAQPPQGRKAARIGGCSGAM